jgi:nitroreductase
MTSEEMDMQRAVDEQSVAAITRVITERRSERRFSDEAPAREELAQVLAAGLAAPYAAAMAPGAALDRRFFVLSRGSRALTAAAAAIQAHAVAALASDQLPPPLRARLEPVAQGRILGVGTAPYYVVIAERCALPAVQQQSLAHALENMWLMATVLGLGMHLVTATTQMGDDADFCGVLGVPVAEYALNGCAIGIPQQAPEARPAGDVSTVTTWLD